MRRRNSLLRFVPNPLNIIDSLLRRFGPFGLIPPLLCLLLFTIPVEYALSRFVDETGAILHAKDMNLTDVSKGEMQWFFVGARGCDAHDLVKIPITGTNIEGKRVHMNACKGVFKGWTLRSQ